MRSSKLVRVAIVLAALGGAGCKQEEARRSPLQEAARACAHDGDVSCARPIFTVRDLRTSMRYYRDALGFGVDWEHGEPPSFGSVTRGHGTIFLCAGCPQSTGAWVMLFTSDVDTLHRELRARGAIVRMPPTTMPWHLREMHVADPDGNVLRFGSDTEHDARR